MRHQLTVFAFMLVAIVIAVGAQLSTHAANAGSGSSGAYTTFDHPSLPCNLSEEAVANWGETSAHLPQACTYDE